MELSALSLQKTLELGFDEAVAAVTAALGTEGFGVLTDIDVSATLKKKLDVDFPSYRILGACHPPSAHQALSAMPGIGILLPCNVVVRALPDGGTEVIAFDPMAMAGDGAPAALHDVAVDVRARLERVLAKV